MENSRAYESFDFGYQKFDSKDDSFAHFRTGSHPSLAFSYTANENGSTDKSSSPLGRSLVKTPTKNQPATLSRLGMKQHSHVAANEDDEEDIDIELEMMKDKFSKLLLGEDMSGSGNSVCSAVAISNSITNLYATVFGQNLRLEPLPPEKKSMWKREMDYLLSVCDYIVEFSPAFENLEDGTSLEMMTSKLRSDIYMNLPALRKLDNMLLEILESFRDTEFWYAERGSFSSNANVATNIGSKSDSFRKITQRKEEKWWLPVPCVPPGGISDKARKHLQHKRDCANQIHKAAMAINNCILAEMQVPDTYMTNLPKTGRTSLGDTVYRYISTTDKFSPEYVLDCIDIKSEHEALEVADKIEASIYIWRRKAVGMISSKSSWNVMDLKIDFEKVDKNLLASRAESLLMYLKQRHPGLSQTTLDTSKIQDNKDVGQAILESYSRVLEGLAFNIVAWVDDVLYADNSAKEQVN